MTCFNWKNGCLGPAKVTVDGIEYERVYEAEAGRGGYIHRYLTDANGKYIHYGEDLLVERIDGHVVITFGEE